MAEDKYRRFEREYAMVATDFYDLAQQSVLASFVREHAGEGALFFGGFEDAERRGIIFLPDYLGIGSPKGNWRIFSEIILRNALMPSWM